MKELAGKIVTVIGAAKSGQAAAKLLHRLKAKVKLSESASETVLEEDFRAWIKQHHIVAEFNGHTKAFIESSDLLVLSPGVRIDAQPVQWANAKQIPVWGEIELASRLCPKPIIAITGSNGKTTVSTLIKKVIDASGKKACLCGNVGHPFTEFVLQHKKYDYYVVEISSFQLETTSHFQPTIAVFLNFSQNHLDRHKDIAEYFTAKSRIFLNQTKKNFAVLNAQDPAIKKIAPKLKAKVRFFNEKKSGPLTHNPNHLAVLEVAKIFRLPRKVCLQVLADFKGVEHRMERVRNLENVEYINDSKATTVEAGRWALQSLHQPIVMICGGRDKHLDFTVLRPMVKQKVKRMIVFGEAKELLKNVFAEVVTVDAYSDLESSVKAARELAQPGDVVLLSPMCTSFDMFKNFEHRGQVFKSIVLNLK